uniref:OMP1269 n=1 Tax=Helicobacter acinonychis TaxID=212 RepID=A0A1M4NGB4_HELAC|nr:OMP1269 [Helicobacter acinonychis]
MDVLINQKPQMAKLQTGHNTWHLGTKVGNIMEIFGESLNAIKNMISNAQAVLEKTKQLNANEHIRIQHPDNFNPYNPNNNKQFAKEMFARTNAQAEILNLAQQVANNFHSIQGSIQGDLQECKSGTSVVANNTYGTGCAFVKETLNPHT